MALWCDKYKPTSLSKLDYNKEIAVCIKRMINSNDFPHLLIYGPPGAGKKTRIQCILKELYGNSIEKLRIEHQTIETASKKRLEVRTVASNYHIEINPSDLGVQDRLVVQDLIKSVAQSGGLLEKIPFKVVVISEAHKLTVSAQHSLRRTMEKYMSSIRLIFCADTSSTIVPPIKSRCLLMRVAAPSVEVITSILNSVAKKENFTKISPEVMKKISTECDRNLRRALLMMEIMKVNDTLEVIKPIWLTFIQSIAKKMIESQTVDRIKSIREDFYELESHLIPAEVTFRILVSSLLQMCDKKLKSKLLQLAAFYEHKMRIGNKRIIHFEAFVAHFLSVYRKFIQDHYIDDEDDLLLV